MTPQQHQDLLDNGFLSTTYNELGSRAVVHTPDIPCQVDGDVEGIVVTWGIGLQVLMSIDDAVRLQSLLSATLYDLAYTGQDRIEGEPF